MTGSDICSIDKCTGCMACANVCPKSCITMKEGELGHLYPWVDLQKCIDCRLCQKCCPENSQQKLSKPLTAFAGWHCNHEDYLSSTSGGAATAFSQYVLEQGGVVYGCVASRGIKVNHIRISQIEDVVQLKGSKYVQSQIGDTYKQVLDDLKSGCPVLFIGTPCQCAGLKSFLKKDYDNLYCVDLICHGVPSLSLLKSHVAKVSNGHGDMVTFRKGNDMGLRVFDNAGQMIYYSNVWNERYKDAYYSTFIDGYTYRESCYRCRYARPERCSDVTIGDFWGLGEDLKHDTVNGCSCVLPITENGLSLVKAANLELFERTVAEAVAGNGQLRHPTNKTLRIKCFRRFYRLMGVKYAYRLCELDNIVTKRLINPIRRRLKL